MAKPRSGNRARRQSAPLSNVSADQPVPMETKASQHPHAMPYPQGFFTFESLGHGQQKQLSYEEAASLAYVENPVAHRCIRLICEAVGSLKLLALEGRVELDQHPALDVLASPNSHQQTSEFLQAIVGHYHVAGCAYVQASVDDLGRPLELHALRPDSVKPIYAADGWVEAYDISAGLSKRRLPNGLWGAEGSLLTLRSFNPLNAHEGLSPLQAAQSALRIHKAASAWNLALLRNSARPSGALVFAPKDGGNLTDEQFDRIKGELEANYTGAKAAGRPLVLEGGLDWKAMGYSPRDMDFIEAKQAAARDIALALGVPPMLLGLPGDNTYSNYREANRAFWRQTVVPLAEHILGGFSHWFRPLYGDDLRISFDADAVADMASDRDRLWERIGKADFLTDEEKRAAVGYGPKDGKDGP